MTIPKTSEPPKMSDEELQLALDLRDKAILYSQQHPAKWGTRLASRFYKDNEVRGMLADFAGHMILEDRKCRTK